MFVFLAAVVKKPTLFSFVLVKNTNIKFKLGLTYPFIPLILRLFQNTNKSID